MFEILPVEIHRAIKTFLQIKWFRKLLNSSKKIFSIPKKQLLYLSLTEFMSYNYCLFDSVRDMALSTIENPLLQVKLNISEPEMFRSDRTSATESLKVHSVKFKNFSGNLSYLVYVKNVEFYTWNIQELTDLPENIQQLSLFSPPLLTSIRRSSVTRIENSMTKNFTFHFLTKCILRSCSELTDVSGLFSVFHVDIRFCYKLEDISCLGNHDTLIIQDCLKLHKVGNITNIRKCSFFFCPALVDLTGIGRIDVLELKNCNKITNVDSLGKEQKHIILDTLVQLTGIHSDTNLRYCEKVTIRTCTRLRDVYALCTVRHLQIFNCVMITDFLPGLPYQHHSLSLDCTKSLMNIDSVTSFAFLSSLSLSQCDSITDLTLFRKIYFLSFSRCSNISDVSCLVWNGIDSQYCQKLIFEGCRKIQEIHGFHSMKRLECRVLSGLHQIELISNINVFIVQRCQQLISFHSIRSIYLAVIDRCYVSSSSLNDEYTFVFEDFQHLVIIEWEKLVSIQEKSSGIFGKKKINRLEIIKCSSFVHMYIDSMIDNCKLIKCEKIESLGSDDMPCQLKVKNLSIDTCRRFHDLSVLTISSLYCYLQRLIIVNCKKFINFEYVDNVPYVRITNIDDVVL
jgi:hypothetical protein